MNKKIIVGMAALTLAASMVSCGKVEIEPKNGTISFSKYEEADLDLDSYEESAIDADTALDSSSEADDGIQTIIPDATTDLDSSKSDKKKATSKVKTVTTTTKATTTTPRPTTTTTTTRQVIIPQTTTTTPAPQTTTTTTTTTPAPQTTTTTTTPAPQTTTTTTTTTPAPLTPDEPEPNDTAKGSYNGGNIGLGTDEAGIKNALGEPTMPPSELPDCAAGTTEMLYTYDNMMIYVRNGIVYKIEIQGEGAAQTAAGLKIGMSLGDMQSIYGTDYQFSGNSYTYTQGDTTIEVMVFDDIVDTITISNE